MKVISPQTVRNQGMTRDEMVKTLLRHGVKATTVAGDSVDESALRALVQKAMSYDGQFHATTWPWTSPARPSRPGSRWRCSGRVASVVFTQFFTRYVLNDSAAWTEEIASYLLIGTVFVGAAIGVAKNNHIQVDLLYRYVPAPVGRWLSRLVDVLRIAFFGAMTVLSWGRGRR